MKLLWFIALALLVGIVVYAALALLLSVCVAQLIDVGAPRLSWWHCVNVLGCALIIGNALTASLSIVLRRRE